MGWLEFIASLVSSLAWPAVIIVLVILLKEPISKLLTSRPMKRIKAGPGGLEIEYVDQALADARQELDAAKAEKPELTESREAADAYDHGC